MSLTFNMVGGGSGGLKATDALLRVQAPANSTVTITKGTTTKTDLGHENADEPMYYDYYFIIHQSQFDSVNPWTVTATHNGISATKTITIDAADEYDLLLGVLILYDMGDQMMDITNGWSASYSTGSIATFRGDRIEMRQLQTSARGVSVYPNNKIDVTDYTTLKMDYVNTTSADLHAFGLADNISYGSTAFIASTQFQVSSVRVVDSVDISGISGEHYVRAYDGTSTVSPYTSIFRVWLEI